MLNRRDCLVSSLASLSGWQGLARAANEPGANIAGPIAAGYKALVCVFLFGGNDGNNLVVPLDGVDGATYADYARLRGALALERSTLLALPEGGAAARFGLHPAMQPLEPLWTQQRLALLFNTGALTAPLTRAEYLRGATRPDNLFSHADQQDFAQALIDGTGARSGWGYRTVRQFGPPAGNAALPTLISLSGNQRFVQGDIRQSIVLPARGTFGMNTGGADAVSRARMDAFRAMWTDAAASGAAPISRQAGEIVGSALSAAGFVNPILQGSSPFNQPAVSAPFANVRTDVGQQLLRVARLIEAREAIGNRRQVFFVGMGGFDTHVNQRAEQARLLGDLAVALRAFHDATEAMGVADQVTSFTMSDFARTLQPNNSGGTDHAWGNHQLVLGGAVRGGRCHGRFPRLSPGGPDDAAREGRWIPSSSCDQYVATLARWFGVPADGLLEIAPHLQRFDSPDLGFMA